MKIKAIITILAVCICVILCNWALSERLRDLRITRKTAVVAELKVEVAATPEDRERGLMFRKVLPENQGMWFIFDEDTSHPFWMKNTYISLDIIFVDNHTAICSIYRNAKPLSLKPIFSKKPYRYVLEVPAGFADRHGLKIKDKIRMKTTN